MEGANLAQVQAESQDVIKKLKEMNNSPNWVANGNDPCQMFKMEVGERIASKGVTAVNYSLEKVVEFFNLPDCTPRINEMCAKYEVLYKDPQDAFRVIYMEMKAPWPISNRDFVLASVRANEGNAVYIGTKSCSYPKAEVNGIVRGELFIAGYILQRIDANSTRVTYISDTDSKGDIPTMVKNSVSAKQGGVAAKVGPAIQKAGI